MMKYLATLRLLRASSVRRTFSSLPKCSVPKTYAALTCVRNRDALVYSTVPVHSVTVVRYSSSSGIVGDFLQYEQLVELMKCGDLQLFDVRDAKEISEQGEFPGAVNIPLPEVKKALQLPKEEFEVKYGCRKPEVTDSNVVFVSQKSIKSSGALEIAHKLGYTKSKQYVNGYEEWQERQTVKKGSAGRS